MNCLRILYRHYPIRRLYSSREALLLDMMTHTVSTDTLFDLVGIPKKGSIQLNENSYDFDPVDPKNHWLYGAFLAFQKLKSQGLSPETFATIGTGSGLDSIGAYEILHPKKIFQTDIHPNVIDLAQKNVSEFVQGRAQVETLLGDLCMPLVERNIKVDFLYANIPNIPSEVSVLDGKTSASRFERTNESCPEEFEKWLLALQYKFLIQAKQVLNKNGTIAVAIGERLPKEILEKLFADTGYISERLITLYKVQTEPEEILSGYAEQELKSGVEFEFYDHEKALPVWQQEGEGKNLSIDEIRNILRPFCLNAKQALRLFKEEENKVGHIYSVFNVFK